MLTKNQISVAYILLAAVYIAGLFVPLMNNDAGEYALLALNMAQENDFINIIRKGQDYLDKPHLLFWLSALSFKIFGVSAWAYKLPSVLFSVLAIYSTTQLGILLFNRKTGILAGLVLGFAQAFIISNYDVRTDAILTGATIYALYNFIRFSIHKKYVHIILGAFGLALAVGTKGLIAVIVTGIAIVLYMMYERKFKELFHWKWLSSIVWFFIFLSPFLICYYLQFDAHPEKTTNGVKGMSGIKFLLWTQSFERLAGQRNMVNNNDPFFFIHTFLWAFLPFSFIAFYETIRDWVILIKTRFEYKKYSSFAFSAAVVLVLVLMSSSKFKLPHYINIIFPLFALIAAKSIMRLIKFKRALPKWVSISLYVVSAAYLLLGVILNGWAFPINNIAIVVFCLVIAGLIFYAIKTSEITWRPVFIAMIVAGCVNLILNLNFFPKVLQYQGSNNMAGYVNKMKIDKQQIIAFTPKSYFAFDFYINRDVPEPGIDSIKAKASRKETFYLFTDNQKLPEFQQTAIDYQIKTSLTRYHVSRLNLKFINPATRKQSFDTLYLLKIN